MNRLLIIFSCSIVSTDPLRNFLTYSIVQNSNTYFTSLYKDNQTLCYPIAHHDGQYFIDNKGLSKLIDEDRIVFKYKNNPNGSVDNIAGILSQNKRVLGLMPHPERAINKDIGDTSGIKLFKSILQGIS